MAVVNDFRLDRNRCPPDLKVLRDRGSSILLDDINGGLLVPLAFPVISMAVVIPTGLRVPIRLAVEGVVVAVVLLHIVHEILVRRMTGKLEAGKN